mgnify:CR=1 FL=1
MGEGRYKAATGLPRLINAIGYSASGLASAYRHEHAFRQEVWLAVVLVPLGLWLPATGIGKALLAASVLLVLIVELINSALEAAVDHTSIDHHPLARRAKDMGSAAVLLSLVNVAAVWGLVLLG